MAILGANNVQGQAVAGGNVATMVLKPWFFQQPISAVAPADATGQEALMLNLAIHSLASPDPLPLVDLLESFVADYPQSVWTPSLRMNLGRFHFDQGAYTKALDNWQWVWEQTKNYQTGPGKRVADYALAHWTRFLAGLGRLEQLSVLFEETQGRVLDRGPLSQKFIRTQEYYGMLRRDPAASYRCGWAVLDRLAKSTRGAGLSQQSLQATYREGRLFDSCSLKALAELAAAEGLSMAAWERPEQDQQLPLKAVVHLKQNHYVVTLAWENGWILAYDPLWGMRYFRPEVLNAEASGYFLILAGQTPAGWRGLTPSEASTILGRSGGDPGWFGGFLDIPEYPCPQCPCPPGMGGPPGPGGPPGGGCGPWGCPRPLAIGAGGSGKGGMPLWRVSEPNINFWLEDEPLTCQPAFGGPVALSLGYKQRDEDSGAYDDLFMFGAGWNSTWLSMVNNPGPYGPWRTVSVYLPGGGRLTFPFATTNAQTVATNYYNNSRLEMLLDQGNVTGYRLYLSDGSQYLYQTPFERFPGDRSTLFMTNSIDAHGFTNSFIYTNIDSGWGFPTFRLIEIRDQANQTLFTLGYTNTLNYPSLVSSVTNRFNQFVQLTYDQPDIYTAAHLAAIRDAAGLVSGIAYEGNGWPESLTTPYGTTSFAYLWSDDPYTGGLRRVIITQPNNDTQIYLFVAACCTLWSGSPGYPEEYPASLLPANLPAGTQLDNWPSRFSSFYWDAEQSQGIPADLNQMTTNHLNKARMRHWLHSSTSLPAIPSLALSFERAPSPETAGTTVGQITWYDYAGKPPDQPWVRGTQIMPSLIARKLPASTLWPNGTTWYEAYERNGWGLPTTKTTTYGTSSPASTRAYSYTYWDNGIDPKEERGPSNELLAYYTYNDRHQVLTETRYANAQTGYTTTYTYYNDGRPYTRQTPAGLTSTFTYNATNYLSQITDQPINRTESFTWFNGYVRTHTDAHGLTVTKTWDALGRLTQEDYPGATSIQYSYVLAPGQGFNNTGTNIPILELTAVKDRLNKWTYYGYDRVRRLVSVKDARNNTTLYAYCGCGSPNTVTNALGKITRYTYNNAGWKTSVLYPDNTGESYLYNLMGQLTNRSDTLGSRAFAYNNQGLLITINNAAGLEQSTTYDITDNPVSVMDANGVTASQTFDDLGRLKTRTYPGTNPEGFGYSARGLTLYTNSNNKVTQYAYDEASRKTSETTPKNETIAFGYNAGSDLLKLTNGWGKVTTWTYNTEGRMLTKQYHGQNFANLEYNYDANGRLSWRRFYSGPGSYTTTSYAYDDVGNLTSINYPSSPDITLSYSAMNQLTNMVDAAGASKFAYTDAGNLLSEEAPWTSSKVTYGYHANVPHLLTSLTLQQPTGNWIENYTPDAAQRLKTNASPAGAFIYAYKGAGTLWTNLALPNTSAITNAFDTAGRLTGTWMRNSGGSILNQPLYQYNAGAQRTRQTRTDSSYVAYGYDNDAQLQSAVGSGGQSTENLGYTYNAAWNMTQRTNSGTPTTYTVNDRDQVTGDGTYTYSYDANGNRTYRTLGNPYLIYTYDDENRLIQVATDTIYTLESLRWRTDFTYDGKGRLRVRKEYYWVSGMGWSLPSETRYLYDGMRVIQERNGSNTPTVAYTRGLDLSGTREGAGGIGGLLARSHGYSGGSWSTNNYYHADAGGNVTYMISSAQAMVATYKYDPFGRTLSSSGTLAAANAYRFSSKEIHLNTGFYYYGYRFYDPALQRWPNRDPLGDYAFYRGYARGKSWEAKQRIRAEGLQNTYRFVHNSPFQFIDINGLEGGYTYLPDGGMKPPIDHVPGEACVQELQNAIDLILGNAGIVSYPTANDDDSLQHCITSCRISRACGRFTAWALGQLKETNDLIHGGTANETDKDLEANQFGWQGAKCKDKSCEDYCSQNRDQYR